MRYNERTMLDQYRIMRRLIRIVDSPDSASALSSSESRIPQEDLKGRLMASRRLVPASPRYALRMDRALARCLSEGLVEVDGQGTLAPTFEGRVFVHRLRFALALARRYRAAQVSAWSLLISALGFLGVAGIDLAFEVLKKATQ